MGRSSAPACAMILSGATLQSVRQQRQSRYVVIDAFGRHGQTSAVPGSIRQRLSRVGNEIGASAGGLIIGGNRNSWGRGGTRDQLGGRY